MGRVSQATSCIFLMFTVSRRNKSGGPAMSLSTMKALLRVVGYKRRVILGLGVAFRVARGPGLQAMCCFESRCTV